MKLFFFTGLFYVLLSANPCRAQETKNLDALHHYSPNELKEDLDQLQKALEEVHPALYRFISKPQLDSLFKVQSQSINEALTASEFGKLIVPLVTAIHCGHTEVDFSYYASLNSVAKFFPLEVTYIEHKLYVLHNNSNDSSITVGDEIYKIDGITSDSITSVLLPLYGVDGYIKTTHKHIMRLLFKEVYALYFGTPDRFEVEFITRGKKNKLLIVQPLHEEEIKQYKAERYSVKESDPFDLVIDNNKHTAILRVSSFLDAKVMNDQYNILRFLDSAFIVIKKQQITRLVLDVRNNAGGNGEHAQYLYSYLTNENFRFVDSIHAKLNHPPSYAPESHVGSYFDLLPSGDYAYRPYPFMQLTKPKKEAYTGKLYVLMNGLTLSSGSSICNCIKAHQRGIFIGEECGSDSHQSNGLPTRLKLHHTGSIIWIAFQTYFRNGGAFDQYLYGRGVIPDYAVHATIEDVIKVKDKELEKAMELIRNNK